MVENGAGTFSTSTEALCSDLLLITIADGTAEQCTVLEGVCVYVWCGVCVPVGLLAVFVCSMFTLLYLLVRSFPSSALLDCLFLSFSCPFSPLSSDCLLVGSAAIHHYTVQLFQLPS